MYDSERIFFKRNFRVTNENNPLWLVLMDCYDLLETIFIST